MEAKELMIGDWVECVDSTHKEKVYAQIDAIEEGQTCILVRLDNCNWFLDISFIKPTPLTPEILKKNGWKHEFDKKDYMVKYNLGEEGKNCWMMWAMKEHNLDIQRQDEKLDVYNLKVSKVVIPCDYVHQLQHAMRICGIEKEIVL